MRVEEYTASASGNDIFSISRHVCDISARNSGKQTVDVSLFINCLFINALNMRNWKGGNNLEKQHEDHIIRWAVPLQY